MGSFHLKIDDAENITLHNNTGVIILECKRPRALCTAQVSSTSWRMTLTWDTIVVSLGIEQETWIFKMNDLIEFKKIELSQRSSMWIRENGCFIMFFIMLFIALMCTFAFYSGMAYGNNIISAQQQQENNPIDKILVSFYKYVPCTIVKYTVKMHMWVMDTFLFPFPCEEERIDYVCPRHGYKKEEQKSVFSVSDPPRTAKGTIPINEKKKLLELKAGETMREGDLLCDAKTNSCVRLDSCGLVFGVRLHFGLENGLGRQCFLRMQLDGNLVMYDEKTGDAVAASKSVATLSTGPPFDRVYFDGIRYRLVLDCPSCRPIDVENHT